MRQCFKEEKEHKLGVGEEMGRGERQGEEGKRGKRGGWEGDREPRQVRGRCNKVGSGMGGGDGDNGMWSTFDFTFGPI